VLPLSADAEVSLYDVKAEECEPNNSAATDKTKIEIINDEVLSPRLSYPTFTQMGAMSSVCSK
jgi:hypothetical protein